MRIALIVAVFLVSEAAWADEPPGFVLHDTPDRAELLHMQDFLTKIPTTEEYLSESQLICHLLDPLNMESCRLSVVDRWSKEVQPYLGVRHHLRGARACAIGGHKIGSANIRECADTAELLYLQDFLDSFLLAKVRCTASGSK